MCRFLMTQKLVVNMEEREALKREIEVLQGNVFIEFVRKPEIRILIPYVDQIFFYKYVVVFLVKYFQ